MSDFLTMRRYAAMTFRLSLSWLSHDLGVASYRFRAPMLSDPISPNRAAPALPPAGRSVVGR